jgi:hypothetical protein
MQSPREGERAVSWPDSVWTRREFPHPARTVWATHGQHPFYEGPVVKPQR